MPAQTANRPWVSGMGNDFAMQQPPQLYQNQLHGTHIDLQPRRNSPMRNQPSSMRPPNYPGAPTTHSERIPIMTADGRFVGGAMPQPQQAPAAHIPIRQPLYHHPPILPQQQHGPLVPPKPQMSGPTSSPPSMPQQSQLSSTAPPPSASALPSHHGHAAPAGPRPMWFGTGKPPMGYEPAPVLGTVPFSSSSHPVLQVAPHPSPFPQRIYDAMSAEGTSAPPNIPAAQTSLSPHPFLKAHSSQQRTSPPRVSTPPVPSQLPQHQHLHQQLPQQQFPQHLQHQQLHPHPFQSSTSIPIRTEIPIGSSSANIKPGYEPKMMFGPGQRGGYGAPQQPQRMSGMGGMPGMMGNMGGPSPISPHHPPNALPMWFGDGPTPPFYQRPTEPWHFTFHGKEPIAKAPVE